MDELNDDPIPDLESARRQPRRRAFILAILASCAISAALGLQSIVRGEPTPARWQQVTLMAAAGVNTGSLLIPPRSRWRAIAHATAFVLLVVTCVLLWRMIVR